ncbi:carboxypeptidase-like regulatory domain-containing protein [Flavobacterium terrisoli]|uniref:alpha-2-macroglobulin family protein n=1 Tax=Flavobacterium terrisoli TaxID=3242195 RepID=UPI0025429D2B|nr:carboxypeptidase-like regulatory domain-containing protein [Flavobacterium buctense]
MKHIYTAILLAVFSFGFSQDFDKNWDKVIQLENEGKIKSANQIVQKIHAKASNSQNEVQLIKTFFYQSKYLLTLEEDAQRKIITNLQKRIVKAPTASKAILNLIYARCLKSYLEGNRSKIYTRTKLDSIDEKDFITWSIMDFEKQIDETYNKTLENEDALKKTPINKYEPIFDFFLVEKFNSSTLYDYLIQANIDYFSQKPKEWDIRNFKDENLIKVLLGSNEEFNASELDSIKDLEILKVLNLYQKAALKTSPTEMEFDRLVYCNRYIIKQNDLLLKRLNSLQQKSKDAYLTQRIQFEKAMLYDKLASKEKFKDYKTKAVTILDSILSVQNKSNTFKKAKVERTKFEARELNVNMLQYSYEKEKTRALVRFTNVDSIQISFYKVNSKTMSSAILNDSIENDFKLKNKVYRSQKYHLKNPKNYFSYSTEVLLPELEKGHYIVFIEDIGNTASEKKWVCRDITVSKIMILFEEKDDKMIFQTLDRKTGKPIPDCQLKSEDFNLKTNDKGIAIFDTVPKNRYDFYNKTVIAIQENDTIHLKGVYNNSYHSEDEPEIKAKVNLYLDRAIYRPGQTVYYKGIATQTFEGKQKIIPNFLLHVTIKNPDYDDLKSFEVTTNDFGSFAGEFVLPKNGLTGLYSINIEEPDDYEKDALYDQKNDEHPIWDNGDFDRSVINFSVEEYKRPKFEANFERVTESYGVNQKVTVNGNAKAFAGSKISDAKVVSRVERNSYYSWRNYGQDNSKTIIFSETKTDADGKFKIEFDAIPAEGFAKENLPVFSYIIRADITDNNGETHSANTTVNVGYHALKLSINVPNVVAVEEMKNINLNSTNLNNQFVQTEGEIKVYYLREFKNKFKRRVFQKPDIQTISDAQFEQLFPYENNETEINPEEKGTLVYTKKVNTETDKIIGLDFAKNYKSGYYKIVFSANDKFNYPIEASASFELYQKAKNKLPQNSLISIKQLNEDPVKDGYARILIQSTIPELELFYTANFNDRVFYQGNISVKNNQQEIKFPLSKSIQGKFGFTVETVFENQYYNFNDEVILKEEVTKVKFEVESFRNKLEPGKEENWSFRIKENDQNAEAEVLASMYDASLDQFRKDYWYGLNNYRRTYNQYYGKSQMGFSLQNFNLSYTPKLPKIEFQNEYTRLMWFGFDINDTNNPSILKDYKKQLNKKAKKPANSRLVTGTVSDRTGPLPGANIVIRGTSRNAQTDFDGYFEIEAAYGEVLIVSFTGYENQKVTINNHEFKIVLDDSQLELKEVVIDGYRTTSKSKSALAQTTIVSNTTVIEEDNGVYNSAGFFLKSLQAQVPGLQISTSSGSPGSAKIRGLSSLSASGEPLYILDGTTISREAFLKLNPNDIAEAKVLKDAAATAIYGDRARNGVIIISSKKALEDLTKVKTRTNRNETAFFFPQLRTDKEGRINFKFNSPEELTAWKFRLFSHNKKAVSGYLEKSVVTQKELMVFPNMPRFFRENDTIVIAAKVANLTSELKNGMAILQLFDATTMENIDAKAMNANAVRNFTIAPSGNSVVSWKIRIPKGLQGLQYKVIAKAGDYSDGEESVLPVLTNDILVTETIPVWVRENSKKEYVLSNLKNNTSTTLRHHLFTLEYTSNPTWIAIQSLPYLMEYEHDCAEQLFSKYYSNLLASEIITSNPKIAEVFDQWRKSGKPISKLEQNEELKSLLLAETPWINDTQSEEEKKKSLALLFDLEKTKSSTDNIFKKLKEKQKYSGGFAWFEGGNENEYITRHIVSGLGHLQKLKVKKEISDSFTDITKRAIPYLDAKYSEHNANTKDYRIWYTQYADLHFLYMRSFYLETYPMSEEIKAITAKQLQAIKTEWLTYSLYSKGLAAIVLYRFGDKTTAKKIIESLKETSASNDDWGMYWIENKAGWYWYQSPIETQALLIEAFAEIDKDNKSVDAMKVWLLKNKQAKSWGTTKATTEAIYALIYQGSNWLSVKDNAKIKIGDNKILTKKLTENEKEAETGYIKMNWKADEISNDMANVSIENKSNVPSYGGIYWQYFEDSDKIKSSDKSLMSVKKELYLKRQKNDGEQLEKITSKNPLKIGDLVTVRLIITTREDMEYIHLKDMRASCFEPVDVLSRYFWKDGTGYYMSTKDAATHLFFDRLNKGTYVIEYDIRVNNKGDFSNGITTIESMYAPEYTSHTKGIRISVAE